MLCAVCTEYLAYLVTHAHIIAHTITYIALTREHSHERAVLCIIHSALTRESNAVYSIYAVGCVH